MEFGAKLRRLMREQRFSQENLARRLDVSQNLVSLWSRGKSFPDIREALALARVFGVSLEFLADDRLDEPPVASSPEVERKVWDVIREIGPEEAYRRLVIAPASAGSGPVAVDGRVVGEGLQRKGAG